MSLTADVTFGFSAEFIKAVDLGGAPKDVLNLAARFRFANGVGAGQANVLWYDERTLAASASEDLDLVGTVVDTYGATFSPARIKAMWLKAAPKTGTANTNDVVFGGASATQWAALLGTTGTVRLRPGAVLQFCAGAADAIGYVCAAGATDLFKVLNSAGSTSVTYQIAIIAANA